MSRRGRRGRAPEAPAQQPAVALELQTPGQLRFTRTEVVVGAAVGAAVIAVGSALGMWLKENLEQPAETESDQTQLSPAPESARFCELKEAKGGVLVREEGVYYLSGYPRQVRGWYLPNGYSGEVPCYWEEWFTDPRMTDLSPYGVMSRYNSEVQKRGITETVLMILVRDGEGWDMKIEAVLESHGGGDGVDGAQLAINGETVMDGSADGTREREETADVLEASMLTPFALSALLDLLRELAPPEGEVPSGPGVLPPSLGLENCPEPQSQPGEATPSPPGPTML